MEQDLNHTIALLARTPAALDALLRGLPEAWTLQNEGERTWTVFDVIGHLSHAERTNWVLRLRWIREFGVSRAFEPIDRKGQVRLSAGKTIEQLLDEFGQVRGASLEELSRMNLQPADFELRGQHPALGTATLSQLLAAWAAHDLTHLHQIARILAHQYREAVGPWRDYLGVMQCAGHSR